MPYARESLQGIERLRPDNWALAYHRYATWEHESSQGQERLKATVSWASFVGVDVPAVYEGAFREWRDIATALPNVILLDWMTVGPLLYGSGDKNVHETGMTFNWTYGVPAIRGSAIKGAMKRVAIERLGLAEKITDDIDPDTPEKKLLEGTEGELRRNLEIWCALFGSVDGGAGITVHDAWLVPFGNGRRPLKKDVLTVHHPNYYQGRDSSGHRTDDPSQIAPPSDTDNPTPIPFLSVRPGVRFLFAVQFQGSEWKEFVSDLLRRALAEGVGAKTNADYGRFTRLPTVWAECRIAPKFRVGPQDELVVDLPPNRTFRDKDRVRVFKQDRRWWYIAPE